VEPDGFQVNLWQIQKKAYAACIDHYSAIRNERAAGHRRTSEGHSPLDFQGADIGEIP
jgi:hypothetical protein